MGSDKYRIILGVYPLITLKYVDTNKMILIIKLYDLLPIIDKPASSKIMSIYTSLLHIIYILYNTFEGFVALSDNIQDVRNSWLCVCRAIEHTA